MSIKLASIFFFFATQVFAAESVKCVASEPGQKTKYIFSVNGEGPAKFLIMSQDASKKCLVDYELVNIFKGDRGPQHFLNINFKYLKANSCDNFFKDKILKNIDMSVRFATDRTIYAADIRASTAKKYIKCVIYNIDEAALLKNLEKIIKKSDLAPDSKKRVLRHKTQVPAAL